MFSNFRYHKSKNTLPKQSIMAEIILPPRARVSFGLPEDGIEVSNISYSEDPILQLHTTIATAHSANSHNNSSSEVRVFHAPNLDLEGDDDDSEDERGLTFLLEDELLDGGTTTISEQTPVPQEAVTPSTPPPAPKKKRSKNPEVMMAIDNLEKVLEDVNTSKELDVTATKKPASLKRSSQSSISLKKTVSKLFGSNKKKQEQQQTDEEEDTIAATPKESLRTPRSKSSKSNNMNKTTKRKSKKESSWKLWKKSKRRGGEHALLLPTKHDDNYSLPDASWKWDVLDGKQTTPPPASSEKDIPKKRNNFLGKLFQKISKSKNSKDETDDVSSSVASPDKTRSLTMEDESDDGEAELLDHLVTICDKTSSLELERGFSSLQERIRSRSFSRLPPESPAGSRTQMFSTSFLEQSPAASRGSKSNSNNNSNSRDDSIPSFASLEEFLTSVSDETHAASLEALLFEQELEKLSTEELAELLDSELEKLMREGF